MILLELAVIGLVTTLLLIWIGSSSGTSANEKDKVMAKDTKVTASEFVAQLCAYIEVKAEDVKERMENSKAFAKKKLYVNSEKQEGV